MKYLITFLIGVCVSTATFAQRIVSDAVLTYGVSFEDAKTKQSVASMTNATYTITVTENQSKVTLTSAAGSESTVWDNTAQSGYILRSYSGQNLMIPLNQANWNQINGNNDQLNFTVQTNGSKTIDGVVCTKAVATDANGNPITVYYDPQRKLANTTFLSAFPTINGLVMQIEKISGSLKYTAVMQNFTEQRVNAATFQAPKSGYRVLSFDEAQQLKKSN